MTFLNRLREYGQLCSHLDPASFYLTSEGTDEWVRCRECHHAASVSNFLCRIVSPLVSPTFAHEYAEWTGHVDVPCTFSYSALRNRVLPGTCARTKFSTLYRGRELLRAIHSPFIRGDGGKGVVDPKIFKRLLKEYVSLIDRISSSACGESGGERGGRNDDALAIRTILSNMKEGFENVDMYEQYFDVLAPFVKYAHFRRVGEVKKKNEKLPEEYGRVFDDEEGGPFSVVLDRELVRSSFLHEHFSPYCVPFEVIQVMVLCYLCGDDTDVVYNLVLDMVAKLCSGFYSYSTSRIFDVGLDVRQFLEKNVTPTKNLKFYYHVKKFRKGGNELGDCFSEEFLRTHGQLESEIRKYVSSEGKMEKFVYQQVFPYLLFEDHDDDSSYYAFVLALAHYVAKSNPHHGGNGGIQGVVVGANHVPPKGVFSECRKLFTFVRECIARVKELDGGEAQNVKRGEPRKQFWTRDTFDLLLATNDGNLGRQLLEVIGTMMYNRPE